MNCKPTTTKEKIVFTIFKQQRIKQIFIPSFQFRFYFKQIFLLQNLNLQMNFEKILPDHQE